MKSTIHLIKIIVMIGLFISFDWQVYALDKNDYIGNPTMNHILGELHSSIKDNNKVEINQRKMPLPSKDVSNALVPELEISLPVANIKDNKDNQRFDIAVKDVPSKQFFMGLVVGTPLSMVVSPAIIGTMSLNLKNVTIESALEAARDAYGVEYEKTSYGYKVFPQKLVAKIFKIDYLNLQRSGQSMTRVTAGSLSDTSSGTSSNGTSSGSTSNNNNNNSSGSSISSTLVSSSINTNHISNFWPELELAVKSIVSTGVLQNTEDRSASENIGVEMPAVVVNPQAGILIVKAYPKEMRIVNDYVSAITNNLSRQVILEAKIIEVELNQAFQSGINWSYLTTTSGDINVFQQGGVTPTLATNADIPYSLPDTDRNSMKDFTGIFGLTGNVKHFGAAIKLLSMQGNVHVLSSPRIATVNNQKAVIKVGQEEYFVTKISGSTTQGTTSTATQNVEVSPFFSGISLDVTPQISQGGHIVLHIHPSVSEVTDGTKKVKVNGSDSTLPLAKSTSRESDSIVNAEDGQVIVIGGLMKDGLQKKIAKVPVLGDIPILGNLFKRTEKVNRKTELVILLKPIIVDRRVWNNDIHKTKLRFNKMEASEVENAKANNNKN